jgi:hypothetical protein
MKVLLRSAVLLCAVAFGFVRPTSAATAKPDLLGSYVKISSALAADDLKAAKTAAGEFSAQANTANKADLATRSAAIAKAENIADARKEFVALSTAVEPLAAGKTNYVVMHCPMADADWVQAKGTTANPYYGKAMLTCGAPKRAK